MAVLAAAIAVLAPTAMAATSTATPWGRVGPGWALVGFDYGTSGAPVGKPGLTKLFVVDPAGHKYLVYTSRSPSLRVLAWSGDGKRALLGFTAASDQATFKQLNLGTGRLTKLVLPGDAYPVGYTRPLGTSVLAVSHLQQTYELARYTLQGRLEKRLGKVSQAAYAAQYSPDGLTVATTIAQTTGAESPLGIALMSNGGGVVRRLSPPRACVLGSWWNATTLLVSNCTATKLYLAPAGRTVRPTLLAQTTRPQVNIRNAWRLTAGTFVQEVEYSRCDRAAIDKLQHGTLERVHIPGGYVAIAAATASKLLVTSVRCGAGPSLAWYDPATHKLQHVLTATSGEPGVTSVAPFYEPTGQP